MDLKTTIQRWTLFLAVLQVTVGCSVRFIPVVRKYYIRTVGSGPARIRPRSVP